jgi:hypothetical protein
VPSISKGEKILKEILASLGAEATWSVTEAEKNYKVFYSRHFSLGSV